LRIKAGGSWANRVNFIVPLTEEQEKSFNELRLKMASDITKKRQTIGIPAHIMVEADKSLVDKAKGYFANNIRNQLGIGRYQAKIVAKNAINELVAEYSFDFHIYEYHKNIFESQKEDYKYGAGITMPINNVKSAWVTIE
jgi:hypothetical protein